MQWEQGLLTIVRKLQVLDKSWLTTAPLLWRERDGGKTWANKIVELLDVYILFF